MLVRLTELDHLHVDYKVKYFPIILLSLLLTWINFNREITVKLFIDSQTATAAPLKFGNG